jgi:hypothetical protein
MTDISFRESSLWLLLCILIPAMLSWWFYFYRKNDFTFSQRTVLASLRGVSVALLLILLLSPYIRFSSRILEKPLLAIAIDNSASIATSSKPSSPDALIAKATYLKEQLSSLADVRVLTFGNNVQENAIVQGKDKATNMSELFDYIDNAFEGQNLSASILISDGLYNTGQNPLFVPATSAHPVFTIALGDTTLHRDVLIADVTHNPKVFKGNSTGVQLQVHARACKGETVKLELLSNGKIMDSRSITFGSQEQSVQAGFTFTPPGKGMFEYEARVSRLAGEKNTINNARKFFVEVIEEKQPILLLADAPHPDIQVIKRALGSGESITLDVQLAQNFDGNFSKYRALVLHNIPSSSAHSAWLQKIEQIKIPVLFITGVRTQMQVFSRFSSGKGFPQGSWMESLPSANEAFGLFTLEQDFSAIISQLPPLQTLYNREMEIPSSKVLLYQKQGALNTRMPMVFFRDAGEQKFAYICGEGLWKWSMHEYKNTRSHQVVEGIIQKSLQYLQTTGSTEPLELLFESRVSENENILMDARLLNESKEPVNEPELNIKFNGNNKNYDFTFSRSGKTYHLDAGLLPPGSYAFTASTRLGERLLEKKGNLLVEPVFAELSDLVANHSLLEQISMQSGGKLFYSGQEENLVKLIRQRSELKPKSFFKKELRDLVSFPIILLIITMLLSAEWLLRKYWGRI